jgi:hypothetical protein
MPLTIEELDGGRGVLMYASGRISDVDLVSALEAHLGAEEVGEYRYSLSDFTAVDAVDVTNRAIHRIAELCRVAAAAGNPRMVAVVGDRDSVFGLARMWQVFAHETGWTTEVFRSRPEAEAWVRERVEGEWSVRPALRRSGRIIASVP